MVGTIWKEELGKATKGNSLEKCLEKDMICKEELRNLFRGLPEEGKDATTEAKKALIKPKYLNRVKSGFDWSGYNRTHYDSDNPPPKIVQGYRFNIFYPDLINKSITPSYHLHDTKDKNVCTIRFTAGPPYKDIAFQIANKPWNKGSRQGFRSTFTKGILQLHFNFVRPRYRR